MFDFEKYIKPETIDETIKYISENPDARLISGGTDILINLKKGKFENLTLIDIHDIKELKFIKIDDNKNILIGSGTTFLNIIESDILKKHIPMLIKAASSIGGPQIRNIATIGGNICNGVTSADSASSLFALNAVLILKGVNGKREISISDFYLGPGKVDLKETEILVGFKITQNNYKGYFGHYYKYAMRNSMDIATIGCAVSLKINNGVFQDYRIAYGVAAPVPMRCLKTEKAVINQKISNKLLNKISNMVEKEVNPRTSWRASKEFRINIIKELSKRVTKKILINVGEKI